MTANVGLYLHDPYARSFEARVLEVADDHVVLDRTAFCPGETGQSPDRGWLRWGSKAANVERVDAKAGSYWHYLDANSHKPHVGQTITGELDWAHRHRMMRTHTAFHLVSAIAFYLCGARATHPRIISSGLRLQFRSDCWCDEVTTDLLHRVNEIITARLPVYTYDLSREEALEAPLLNRLKIDLLPPRIRSVRVVEIEGIALEIDLGTHVRSTDEIGSLQLLQTHKVGHHQHQVDFRLLAPAKRSNIGTGLSAWTAGAHATPLPPTQDSITPNQFAV